MKTAAEMPLVLPPALLAEVQAAAQEEHRGVTDILQDAVKRYLQESRWRRVLEAGHARAQALGYTEADVPRLIADYREEQRQGG